MPSPFIPTLYLLLHCYYPFFLLRSSQGLFIHHLTLNNLTTSYPSFTTTVFHESLTSQRSTKWTPSTGAEATTHLTRSRSNTNANVLSTFVTYVDYLRRATLLRYGARLFTTVTVFFFYYTFFLPVFFIITCRAIKTGRTSYIFTTTSRAIIFSLPNVALSHFHNHLWRYYDY